MTSSVSEEKFAEGRRFMAKLHGVDMLPASVRAGDSAYIAHTVGHLFAEVWARPGLPMHDRRLLVLGATSMLGREDLVEVQAFGALNSGDLTPGDLQEALLQLAYYAGWPNSTALMRGIAPATAKYMQSKA